MTINETDLRLFFNCDLFTLFHAFLLFEELYEVNTSCSSYNNKTFSVQKLSTFLNDVFL